MIDAIEPSEDAALLARGDADAVVLDGKHHTLRVAMDAQQDAFLRRCVLHRIVEQVDQRRDQRLGIGDDRRKIRLDADVQVAAGRQPVADRVERRCDDR